MYAAANNDGGHSCVRWSVPDMLPKVQVDAGAIKFILSGADIMCPGLTSAGGRISADLAQGAVVVCIGLCPARFLPPYTPSSLGHSRR